MRRRLMKQDKLTLKVIPSSAVCTPAYTLIGLAENTPPCHAQYIEFKAIVSQPGFTVKWQLDPDIGYDAIRAQDSTTCENLDADSATCYKLRIYDSSTHTYLYSPYYYTRFKKASITGDTFNVSIGRQQSEKRIYPGLRFRASLVERPDIYTTFTCCCEGNLSILGEGGTIIETT